MMTSRKKILVVDDTPMNVRLLVDLLGFHDYDVMTAASGQEALNEVNRNRPDLILLDVVMPEMTGYEVCRKVRERKDTAVLPIVMVTALDPGQERVNGIEAGADDFLTKPINKAELLARVRSLLRVKELHDTVQTQAAELAIWNKTLEHRVQEQTDQNQQLKEMDRLKSRFLAHVSHELRTPLTSIEGLADNMLEGLAGVLSEKQRQHLTRIKANGSRLARMITDLLDRSSIEAGKLELSLQEVPLAALASEVIEQVRPIALAKDQRLQLECDDPAITCWADADRLSQIMTNLVDNAIKYTSNGGAVVVRVTRESARFAKVTVADNGPGIPRDALPNIFDPFFRASQHARSRIKGLGLGLSIVKELVEIHGGMISVQSEGGKGTEFRFTVPLRPDLEEGTPSCSTSVKRILVVDDDVDICQLLQDRLGSYGYQVETAHEGGEALDAYRSAPFDGVILDIGMPKIDGLEVLREIRLRNSKIPIVMVTACGSVQRAVQAIKMGAQAYVLKPFDLAELQRVTGCWFGIPL